MSDNIENTTTLESIDYAHLIQYAAQQLFTVLLNKTQINKILFYVYGVYLAEKGVPLFSGDRPKAWPYGPVFPRANKRVNTDEIISFRCFSSDQINELENKKDVLYLIDSAVKHMYNKSAYSLTQWSHQEGSPWYRTIYPQAPDDLTQKPWNTVIDDALIKEYFSNPKNRIFDERG